MCFGNDVEVSGVVYLEELSCNFPKGNKENCEIPQLG
jgi:hypothetical protein